MKSLTELLKEIRRGENIELYLVLIAALSLIILDLFGLAKSDWVSSITIAILALLALSLLGNRHRLETINAQISKSIDKVFLKDFPENLNENILNAKELWIVGINLGTTSSTYYQFLKDGLYNDQKIKILIVDPNGIANKLGSMRHNDEYSETFHRATILKSLVLFTKLKEKKPSLLDIRTIDYLPSFGFFAVDPEAFNGAIYIEHYGFKLDEGDVPRIALKPKDEEWFILFQKQLFKLWNEGKDWDYNSKQTEEMISSATNVNI